MEIIEDLQFERATDPCPKYSVDLNAQAQASASPDISPADKNGERLVCQQAQSKQRRKTLRASLPSSTLEKLSRAMADLDVRPRNDRSYNSRKRRYREDDDPDRRPPRRRYEEPPGIKLRKQFLAIADSPLRNPEDDIANIARIACDNYDDEQVRSGFLDLAIKLVVEQPFKIPFIAAVIKVINQQKQELATEALSRFGASAQDYIDAGAWRAFKLVLRLLACLHDIFENDGVFPILEELFNRAVDLQTASSEDSVGLELVKIILLTIPYLLASSDSGLEQRAVELLEKTDIIASTPHALEALVDVYPWSADENTTGSQSLISLVQKQLQEEASRGWKLACIPRVSFVATAANGPSTEANTSQKHPFPAITVPQPVNPGPKPLFPEMFFSLYADQDVETVPPTTDIAGSLLRDALVDTINILDFNRNAVAKILIDTDCYWAPGTFVKRATPFDRLKEVAGDKSTWKPEDMAVDAVFSQLFQLPTSEHKLVYYHSIITEACRVAPAAIAPSLGRAIRYLFQRVDLMDMELSYRFLDWFAHHLSNFEFRWKWAEWTDDLARPDMHPKKAFIIGVLDKEIRLSFAKRIRETLPEPYHPLIPEGKEKDIPDFKYKSPTTPFSQEGQEIMTLIRKKAPDEEIQPVIDRIHAKAAELEVTDVHVCSTDAFVTAICYVGSKSLSHVLSCIERCKDRLLNIGPTSAAARRQIITSVVEYWKDQPGVAVTIIDKLLNYTIITPMSVVEWALVDHLNSGKILSENYVYEMVSVTVFKVTNRVRQIVAARLQPGLPDEQVGMLDATLMKERDDMRALFRLIEDALNAVAAGANDEMIENGYGDESEGKGEEGALIRGWGERWLRVFRRKFAVEESVVGEDAVAAAIAAAGVAEEEQVSNGQENGGMLGSEEITQVDAQMSSDHIL